MKLVIHNIVAAELQTYLDKYQDKIKFILPCVFMSNASSMMLVIDEGGNK